MERIEGTRGHEERRGEHHQATRMMAEGAAQTADAERHAAVGGHVGNGAGQQYQGVGRLRRHPRPQYQVQAQVGKGAHGSDAGEPQPLCGRSRARLACLLEPQLRPEFADRDLGAGKLAHEPGDASQVTDGGGDDVDPGVRIVDPVDRDLVDP